LWRAHKALGRQAGHEIDLARIEPEPWNQASIESFRSGDYSHLRDVIAVAIVREREHQQEGERDGERRRECLTGQDRTESEREISRATPERERTERVVESDEKRKQLEQHAERSEGVAYYLAKRAADRERGGGGRER
jgi:hypothetical protein